MDKIKEIYQTYRVYLTRQNMERATLVIIVLSIFLVLFSSIPRHRVLTLDQGAIRYEGNVVRGKMNGQGTLTFKNGDSYTGNFKNGQFDGTGTFVAQAGWKYEGQFVNGQAEGQGKLTTENNVVYEGKFKQGIYQNEN